MLNQYFILFLKTPYSDLSNNHTGLNKRTPWKNIGKIIIVQEGINVHGGKRLKKIRNNGPAGVIFCHLNNIFHFLRLTLLLGLKI